MWGVQTNSNSANRSMASKNGRRKAAEGSAKSMEVEMQIEISEDAATLLTPEIIRAAFRMSLVKDVEKDKQHTKTIYVHKVIVDE